MIPYFPTERHLAEPDFRRPLLQIEDVHRERLLGLLTSLYGESKARRAYEGLERILRVYHATKTDDAIAKDADFRSESRFSERDVILITYGDLIRNQGKAPLEALTDFLHVYMRGAINGVHILPFYPSSSDRGFSVMDFYKVDPRLGDWKNVHELGQRFRLMFDVVANHVSAKGTWFRQYQCGNPEYTDFFVDFDRADAISDADRQKILRPRTSDLLTPFSTLEGERYLWTTFSADQIDLNYRSERVLLRMIELLLDYHRRGADLLRLDAVTYLWWELGTNCANLEQTHTIIRLFRAALDVVAPPIALVTETKVPHVENVRYFGDGNDEAQMVYNFALPPLVLLSFLKGDCSVLAKWARSNTPTSPATTFFNFLDSHDGIGVLPIRDLVSADDLDWMTKRIRDHGGLISYRANGDGTKSPYEMNCTWFSAVNGDESDEPQDLQVDRYVASRSIALALAGVPGIYVPSLFGSKNDHEAVRSGGGHRAINRKEVDEKRLFLTLMDPNTIPHKIARRFGDLIKTRVGEPAFHPSSRQAVIDSGSSVFTVVRENETTGDLVVALTNVTPEPREVRLTQYQVGRRADRWNDLASDEVLTPVDGVLDVSLRPYQVLWLKPAV